MFWKSLEDKKVQCLLCPQKCMISDGKIGGCRVRKNIAGVLYSLNSDFCKTMKQVNYQKSMFE